jgi:hypothetical protein
LFPADIRDIAGRRRDCGPLWPGRSSVDDRVSPTARREHFHEHTGRHSRSRSGLVAAIRDGDIGLGDPFQMTCESIEALHVISGSKLLFGCDNNFPNTGRNPAFADDTEFIVVGAPALGRG